MILRRISLTLNLWMQPADVVVIGGAEELLSYEVMNAAFRMLMDGATLLAMHTNRYWRPLMDYNWIVVLLYAPWNMPLVSRQ